MKKYNLKNFRMKKRKKKQQHFLELYKQQQLIKDLIQK